MAMVQEQQQKKKVHLHHLHHGRQPPRNNLLASSSSSSSSSSVSSVSSAHPHSIATPPPPPPPPDASSSAGGCLHVIYYLCRSSYGGHLEHPHLLRLPRPRHRHLLLRDVKQHLSMIRGSQFPSAFAWSYKRSYRNGYVWQDLSDDEDIIFPSGISYSYGGGEFVLKGSEITGDGHIHGSDHPIKPLAIDAQQNSRREAAPAINHNHHHQDTVSTGPLKDREISDDCKPSSASSGLVIERDLKVIYPTDYPNLRQVSVDVATQTASPIKENKSFDYPAQSNNVFEQNPATEIDMKSELFLNPSPPSSSDSTISSNPNYSPSTDSHAISRSDYSCGVRLSPSRPKICIEAAVGEELDDDAISNLEEDNHVAGKKIGSEEEEEEIHRHNKCSEAETIPLISSNDRNGIKPTCEETTNPSTSSSVHLRELLLAHDDEDEDINPTISSTINANHTSNHDRSSLITSALRQHQSGAMSIIRFLNSCSGIGGLEVKEQSNRHSQRKLTPTNRSNGTNAPGNGGINAAAANHANCTIKFGSRQTELSTDPCRIVIHDDFAVYNINVDNVNHSSLSSNLMISNKMPANRTGKPNFVAANNQHQSERKKNDEDNRRDTPKKKDHSTLDTINRPAVISDMISSNYGCKSAGCSPVFVPREHYYTKVGLRLEMLSKPNYNTNRSAARLSNPRFEILNDKANYRKPVSVRNPRVEELQPGTINCNQDSDG